MQFKGQILSRVWPFLCDIDGTHSRFKTFLWAHENYFIKNWYICSLKYDIFIENES